MKGLPKALETGAGRRRFFMAAWVTGLAWSVMGTPTLRAQEAQPRTQEAQLRVQIDGAPAQVFTLAQLQALPQQDAEVNLRSGGVERWRGVPVTELLKASGLNLADSLGGGFVSRRVLAARSADGYVAAFGLAEVDPRFGRRVPIVAWQAPAPQGGPLAPHRGPLMLVAPDDARGSRGVRQLQSLAVVALP